MYQPTFKELAAFAKRHGFKLTRNKGKASSFRVTLTQPNVRTKRTKIVYSTLKDAWDDLINVPFGEAHNPLNH